MDPVGGNTCPVCGTPITVTQAVQARHCGAVDCRTKFAVDAEAAKDAAWVEEQEGRAADLRARSGLGVAAAVPRQVAELVEPPQDQVKTLKLYIEMTIDMAFAENTPVPEDPFEQPLSLHPVTVEGCTACRGLCCANGLPNMAYITKESIARTRAFRPDCTAETLLAHYVERLPQRHVAGSCLYHGERGCALDRVDRSAICNRFLCRSIRAALDTSDAHPGEMMALGAFSDEGDLVEIRKARIPAPADAEGPD